MTKIHIEAGLVAAVLTFLLAGCSASDANVTSSATTPVSPLTQRLIACMDAAGFEAIQTWDGGMTYEGALPEQQVALWNEAADRCGRDLGYDKPLQLTQAQLEELYQKQIAERDCLIRNGQSVDEPPSLATFKDGWDIVSGWSAWWSSGAKDLGKDATYDLAAKCPPPEWFLNLDGM